MLPATIPIFPLPDVVLFPSVFLPLHIFEPRYRQMLAEALRSDRIIGMVLLRGNRDDIEEPPPVHPIGCAGLISHAEQLGDGRSNIILRGLHRFRIVQERYDRPYRRAQITPLLPSPSPEAPNRNLNPIRTKLEALLAGRIETVTGELVVPNGMGDEDLINTLAQYLELDPAEKQALLEFDDLTSRAQGLIDLIEMREFITLPLGGLNPN
ncbi:MAG: ATP-dependent protease [Acidobacteria bacterium]|nr:ATP-dependent protease [Acidobacteriota bacterium]